jgi:hypothetical protein
MENNLHLFRPTTPGQIYDLFFAGRIKDSDFEFAMPIIKTQIDLLKQHLSDCEQWQIENIIVELQKYEALYFRMNESIKNSVQGQKAAECLHLAEKNWMNAAKCSSHDEQLVYIERCLGYARTAGLEPISFILNKAKELIAA